MPFPEVAAPLWHEIGRRSREDSSGRCCRASIRSGDAAQAAPGSRAAVELPLEVDTPSGLERPLQQTPCNKPLEMYNIQVL